MDICICYTYTSICSHSFNSLSFSLCIMCFLRLGIHSCEYLSQFRLTICGQLVHCYQSRYSVARYIFVVFPTYHVSTFALIAQIII